MAARRPANGYHPRVIAFLPTLGFQEMFVLLVLGILLFGRNLPQVGRSLGKTVAQLRRGMQDFKDQMDRDESIRDLRNSVRDTRNEVANQVARIGSVPRALADPGGVLRDAARDALMAPPAPDGDAVPPAADAGKEPAAEPRQPPHLGNG